MKIAEETGDTEQREQAKVNFGMANASMKWANHVTNILTNLQNNEKENMKDEDEEEGHGEDKDDQSDKLPAIKKK